MYISIFSRASLLLRCKVINPVQPAAITMLANEIVLSFHFISCSRWLYVHHVMLRLGPISDRCLFREASANQEALQGPIPPTHQFYCYFCHDDCFIYCWFIKLCYLCGCLCCCELQTCFAVYLMWRHVKSIFPCFRLKIPFVYFGISDDVLLDFLNWW